MGLHRAGLGWAAVCLRPCCRSPCPLLRERASSLFPPPSLLPGPTPPPCSYKEAWDSFVDAWLVVRVASPDYAYRWRLQEAVHLCIALLCEVQPIAQQPLLPAKN